MPAQMLFANRAPNAERLSLILIKDGSHKFGARECMQAWVESGELPSAWSYSFTLVKVTDKTPGELAQLVEGKQFIEPPTASEDYLELATTGEMTRTYSQIEQYING